MSERFEHAWTGDDTGLERFNASCTACLIDWSASAVAAGCPARLRAELERQRARPRPKVEVCADEKDPERDLLRLVGDWSFDSIGYTEEQYPGVWRVWSHTGRLAQRCASRPEARAALVAAAEAAGFDVSACRAGETT